MKHWVQRIRGAIGIGLTWAAGWTPIGAITGAVTAMNLNLALGEVATNYAIMFGVLGFVGGALFSMLLSLADGRRTFEQLSLPRFVLLGAAGGLALGGLAVGAGLLGVGATMIGVVIAGASTLLGAASAAGTLAIARAANRSPQLTDVSRPLLGNEE